jgi:hypothetical protein
MLFREIFELSNNFSVENIKTHKGKSFQLVNLPIFAVPKIRCVLDGLRLKIAKT